MSYEDLLVYRLSVTIQDCSVLFCQKFLADPKFRRTVDQIEQANRSCKQNIAEGISERSIEGQLKLVGVSRASYSELKEDYKDFLRLRGLSVGEKDDPRILRVRSFREEITNSTNLTNLSNWTNLSLDNPEEFANLILCLIYKESYLLDQLLRKMEDDFVKNGGYRENLFKKRLDYRKTHI